MLRNSPTLCALASLFLILNAYSPASAAEPTLTEFLQSPDGQAALDQATMNAPERLDKVTLVHLGKNSNPLRHKMIREAKNNIFISSPYWFNDETGNSMLDEMKAARAANPALDMRLFGDWLTPAQSGDFHSNKTFKTLREVTGGQVSLWNRLTSQRSWSFNVPRNRVHDKLVIVDGEKLLMGGMNMGNTYLEGGLTREGWHDTDVLIEGKTAQDAQKVFLKNYLLSDFLNGSGNFATVRKEQINILQDIYYRDKSEVEYTSFDPTAPGAGRIRVKMKLPLPLFENDPDYFPSIQQTTEMNSPTRFVFDHPFVDRDPETGKHFSKTRRTLEVLFRHARNRIRIFLPYLTITPEFEKLLVAQASRGIKVEIITNSMVSHDLTSGAYFASFSHYPALADAGVQIYEWAGHPQLVALEKTNDCTIPVGSWPGATLHTKMAIVDGEVIMMGSHNMNVRSETYNTESMALIMDSRIAQEAEAIFEHDLDLDANRTIPCGDRELERPTRVNAVTREFADDFYQKNLKRILKAASHQWRM